MTQGDSSKHPELDSRLTLSASGLYIFKTKTMDDVDKEPDLRWMIDTILQKGSVSIVFCESGTGKSFFAMHTAQCIAHDMKWFGFDVLPGRVLYFYVEAFPGAKARQQAWNKHYQKQNSPNFTYVDQSIHLSKDRDFILDTIRAYNADLAIVDAWAASSLGTNRVDPTAVLQSLGVAMDAARDGRHVMLIHHTNSKGLFAGAMAFKDAVNTMIELKREKGSSIIQVQCEKQKEADEFSPFNIELHTLTIGKDKRGIAITSCYLEETTKQTGGQVLQAAVKQQAIDKSDAARALLKTVGDMNTTTWMSECEKLGITHSQFNAIHKELEAEGKVTYHSSGKGREKIYTYQQTELEAAQNTLHQKSTDDLKADLEEYFAEKGGVSFN